MIFRNFRRNVILQAHTSNSTRAILAGHSAAAITSSSTLVRRMIMSFLNVACSYRRGVNVDEVSTSTTDGLLRFLRRANAFIRRKFCPLLCLVVLFGRISNFLLNRPIRIMQVFSFVRRISSFLEDRDRTRTSANTSPYLKRNLRSGRIQGFIRLLRRQYFV